MAGGNGGRLTLRLVSSDGGSVEYAGELQDADRSWAISARVGVQGEVDVERAPDAPDWLVATARATLRTAWRASKAGTPWPRRLSRWRAATEDGGAEQ
ncbi:MAG TPA: hypothetical protein VHC69_23410 [Polyangiaceae bacterium]|nr:hypothetical protein [Polyangiaceae bacterium]